MSSDYIVGIDEAGRGPLAGPVFVASVFADYSALCSEDGFLDTIRDSKKLSEKKRDAWFKKIKGWERDGILKYKYSYTSASDIDKNGIVPSTLAALSRTLEHLEVDNDIRVLLDGGLQAPKVYKNQETIIKGDEKEPVIALASIVAKVNRDKMMRQYHVEFPEYGFNRHKGYGTKAHMKALEKHGPCEIHRRSFLRT